MALKNINGTTFDIDFCKLHSPEKLRKIYSGETKETLDKLITEVYPVTERKQKEPKKEVE